MGYLALITGLVIALICAWLVNALIGLMSGERPGDTGRLWWNIFSNMGARPSSYAEPLPDLLKRPKFGVGDRICVLQAPSEVERSMSGERQKLLQRCVGKVLRVERIDNFGALEVHVLDDGTQARDRNHHVVYIEPKYAECVTAAEIVRPGRS